MASSDRVSYHGRAGYRAIVWHWVRRLRPVGAAKVITAVLAEEGADSPRAEVGYAVVAIPRQDDGVREDDCIPVDAALEIAENELAA